MKLESIRSHCNLIATPSESTAILHELLYMMNDSPDRHDVVHFVLEIFLHESPSFVQQRKSVSSLV